MTALSPAQATALADQVFANVRDAVRAGDRAGVAAALAAFSDAGRPDVESAVWDVFLDALGPAKDLTVTLLGKPRPRPQMQCTSSRVTPATLAAAAAVRTQNRGVR